jgi:CO/xanthine dehydrogenase Mo-binding subunit
VAGGGAGAATGIGLACGVEKGGYTACCVEVDVATASDDGRPRPGSANVVLRRVVVAFECGAIVNPDGLHNQVEGAIVQGLGGALFEAIDFEDGRLTNGRFAQYRLPRFADVPPIDVVLLNRLDLPPAGAGETPIVGLAPAIGNAIFDATGVRLRSLPLIPRGLPAPTRYRSAYPSMAGDRLAAAATSAAARPPSSSPRRDRAIVFGAGTTLSRTSGALVRLARLLGRFWTA